jgi:hypothetical protein
MDDGIITLTPMWAISSKEEQNYCRQAAKVEIKTDPLMKDF